MGQSFFGDCYYFPRLHRYSLYHTTVYQKLTINIPIHANTTNRIDRQNTYR